jgi:hypothetical protein
MKKLSIKNIVEFRGKSDRSKKYFATDLTIDKVKVDTEGGGDYWVSCLSAISNSFKSDDLKYIIDKRGEVEEKHGETKVKRTKTMYERNIDILYNYKDFDLKKWKPSKKIKLLKKNKDHSILTIKGLQVQATPHHVFTFQKNDVEEVGAIWFIAKLNGFKKDELGMFADILYRYLKTHFSKDYDLNPKYCIAVDVFKKFEVNYSQLEKGEISLILNPTLEEIKKLM